LQSRELGEVGPGAGAGSAERERGSYAATIASKPAPVAKSWAHFVAGGYVKSPSLSPLPSNPNISRINADTRYYGIE